MSNIKEIIGKDKISEITKLFGKVIIGREFEFILFSKPESYLTQERYINLLKYYKAVSKKNKYLITPIEETLDINYTPEKGITYRISIDNDYISDYMERTSGWRNSVVYSSLVTMYNKGRKGINLLKKSKKGSSTIDIDEINTRVRLSDEVIIEDKKDVEMLKKLIIEESDNIIYRYKKRISVYIAGSPEKTEFVRVDLTQTKTAKNYKSLNRVFENHEIEIEVGSKMKPSQKLLNTSFNELEMITKIIQQSSFVISESTKQNVLSNYRELVGSKDNDTGLYTRNPVTLEVRDITKNLPNQYSVTDKADGERNFMIIHNKRVYFINTNLEVKYSGIELKISKYDDTILDGEFILIKSRNRQMFMAFDCLFVSGDDIRNVEDHMERLRKIDKIIDDIFVLPKQKGFKIKDVPASKDVLSVDKIREFHKQQLVDFYKSINNDLDIEPKYPLVRRKYFISVFGVYPWEIFSYAVELWNFYTRSHKPRPPYMFDGLMFHPIKQSYVVPAGRGKFKEYKWKPQDKNSIDFYVEFARSRGSGDILTVFDNSENENIKNRPYRICRLYVGSWDKGRETPVPFKPDIGLDKANLFIENGFVRDIEGNVISDRTVVEFYYSEDESLSSQFRWIPMRTRHDKTENVLRYRTKYGNNKRVAENVWDSIANPIKISDMEELAKGNDTEKRLYFYDTKINELRSMINKEKNIQNTKENIYYQKKTTIATGMRAFHNWIKSNLIYTYFSPVYQSNRQLSVLDIACGRGGDIMKFYRAKISMYVGIDVAKEGLFSKLDSATSRYNSMRERHPNFPKMEFIHADAGVDLEYEAQNQALGGMRDQNRKLIKTYFDEKPVMFDRINCQFALHYFLKDESTWNSFKNNIKKHLRNDGYFVATTFDMGRVMELLKGRDRYTAEYTEDGNTSTLFEIVKLYDESNFTGKNPNYIGNAIDLHAAWMFQSGTYMTEYLVSPDFVKSELEKECNMELVDTGLFSDQLELHRDYFKNTAPYFPVSDTRDFNMRVAEFYKEGEINEKTRIYNGLMRYYVFRRIDNAKKISTVQKGGRGNELDFYNPSKFMTGSMSRYNPQYSLMNSIFDIIHRHKYVPRSLTPEMFYNDLGVSLISDQDFIDDDITSVCKNILVRNEIKGNIKTLVNGVNLFVVERDCNNNYDIDLIDAGGRKYMIVLKEGNLYTPIYKFSEDGETFKGVFSKKDSIYNFLMKRMRTQ